MEVNYISQPDKQLGKILSDMLNFTPAASRIIFVSAFVSIQAVMRIKQQILGLRETGCDIRFVVGIDLGGTSQEVLKELLEWEVDVRIVKHRFPRHTFHPKLYLFEWANRADIIIGSNNLTEGGLFGNYEGAVHITYSLPSDAISFDNACGELGRFLHPEGPVTYQLTAEFLDDLIDRGDIPTEVEARRGRHSSFKSEKPVEGESIFGVEDIDPPPPLPANLLERLVKNVRMRRTVAGKATRKKAVTITPVDAQGSDLLSPAAFYMTLPTLQGRENTDGKKAKIPGEARVPIEAIDLAKEFWGWQEEYEKDESPRGGKGRVYWNWKPLWKVWSVSDPEEVSVHDIRMYLCESNSDFRFYAKPLVNAGGDLGDVVRIRRIASPDAEYECVLARKGTPEYDEWIQACTQPVRNSTRSFGYA